MRTHVHSLRSLAVSLGFIWGRALQSSPCSLGSGLRSSPHCKGAATHCDPRPVCNRCKPGISTSQQSGILYKCDKPNVFGVYENYLKYNWGREYRVSYKLVGKKYIFKKKRNVKEQKEMLPETSPGNKSCSNKQ